MAPQLVSGYRRYLVSAPMDIDAGLAFLRTFSRHVTLLLVPLRLGLERVVLLRQEAACLGFSLLNE